MNLSLFDTHADTPYEAYKRATSLRENGLHVSLDMTDRLASYCQCMAIWSDKTLSDDAAFAAFKNIYAYFTKLTEAEENAVLVKSYAEIAEAKTKHKAAFILTVEDARLLSDDIGRLEHLSSCGVKLLTLQWQRETLTGGGFDTDAPLTDYGKMVVKRCAELGIIPDISHANESTARDIIETALEVSCPVIATHSNSYSVCRHKRNMSDTLYSELVNAGGIVGISLAPQHLNIKGVADSEDVFAHIDHYAEREGIEHICLGCDFDGIETTPRDINNLSEIENIAEVMLRHNYNESYVRAVFSDNAHKYMARYLK